MSKELEALKRIRQETAPATYNPDFDKKECCDVIEQALQRLEQIDNANPSEALKCLDKLAKQIELDEDTDFWEIRNAHKIVEQALIKAQEQEKVLDIIKEKSVDVYTLFDLGLEEYNKWVLQRYGTYYQLTQEEFKLLKEVLKNE